MKDSYLSISKYYNKAFNEYGATPKGLAWDNLENLLTRYKVMYDLIREKEQSHITNSTILDFGCGYGGFYNYINTFNDIQPIYSGLDINSNVIEHAKKENPEVNFFKADLRIDNINIYDYIICNGTFTVKNNLSQDDMWNYMTSILIKLWDKTNEGIAFNVMSKIVDWEREDLFHVSMDILGQWLVNNLSRNFIIRNDYGLYEYTVYVYKNKK